MYEQIHAPAHAKRLVVDIAAKPRCGVSSIIIH